LRQSGERWLRELEIRALSLRFWKNRGGREGGAQSTTGLSPGAIGSFKYVEREQREREVDRPSTFTRRGSVYRRVKE